MRCELIIRGNVQDAGYRKFVEGQAEMKRLRGLIFNDETEDKRVNVICDGPVQTIDDFVRIIDIQDKYVSVDKIEKHKIESNFTLPEKFSRLQTDTQLDMGRKLDKGNEELVKLNVGQDRLVEGQDKGFKSIVSVLERIEKKL